MDICVNRKVNLDEIGCKVHIIKTNSSYFDLLFVHFLINKSQFTPFPFRITSTVYEENFSNFYHCYESD
jgi:hypothetical protein